MKGSFHIADWEIHPQINCVTKGDRSYHLEPKVMQVLVHLASRANEVLSKEELIHTIWADTFVGDDVLTRSISEIRRALEDDARSPKFIQTIPKVGYRLIGAVAYGPEPEVKQTVPIPAPAPTEEPKTSAPAAERTEKSDRAVGWLLIPTLLVLSLIGFWALKRETAKPLPTPRTDYKTIPFTSNLGAETQPAFSPGGKQVAFVWRGEDGGFRHLYVKLIGAETQLQLTSGNVDDYSPTWSPDGTSIAFLRLSGTDRGLFIVPAIGGAARKIYTPEAKSDLNDEWERGALSWSPDGKRLIFPDGKSSKRRSMIYSLEIASREAIPITSPPEQIDGDFTPAFSPDGSHIAFARGTEGFVRDVYVMDAGSGEPRRLTFDNRYVSSLAWTADGTAIIFSSNRGGKISLWRVSLKGGEPERLPFGEDASSPAIARTGDMLAYAQRSAKWSIVRVALSNSGQAKNAVTRLLSSTEQDSAPRFSPDGSRIAFQSWRSGTQEVWVCSSAGTDLVKLTSYGGPLTGSPTWSPDGQQIAFDSRPEGHSHIYAIALNGGIPRAITSGEFNDIVPSWSHDAQWIYFGSNRSGSWQVWRAPAKGGDPQQVTHQGGFVGIESEDGQWLYYVKNDTAGIWRVPVGGGDEVSVMNDLPAGSWASWTLSAGTIYFLNKHDSTASIDAFHLDSHRTEHLHLLDRTPASYSGLTIAPDGKSLVYTDLAEAESHITLVQNFR